MLSRIRALWRRRRGFTLVEIMSVMTILSVLSAVTFPAISGSTTFARATSQSVDMSSVQAAVDRFANDAQLYPTLTALPGTSNPWVATQLPQNPPTGGAGFVISQPLIFVPESIAPIDFGAVNAVPVTPQPFVGSYLRSNPEYHDKTIGVAADQDSPIFRVKKYGRDYYIKLRNTTTSTMNFHRWGIDKNGDVWVFVDQDAY